MAKISREEIVELYKKIINENKNLAELYLEKRNNFINGFYVFDENQSVKWNREKCDEHNLNLSTKVEEKKKEIGLLEIKLEEYIREYFKLTQKGYSLIREFAYNWNQSAYNMEDGINCYLDFIDDIIELVAMMKGNIDSK